MALMRQVARSASLWLGTGYTLFFFSETMFWSLWRPDENPLTRAAGILFYSFLGYMLLALIAAVRVRDVWTLLVAGACFGWLGEGVFAMTLFGAGGIPFPFTIAWTALAWHAPLSVVVGWWWLGRALRASRPWLALLLSVGIGLFWGIWGYGWQFETPPVVADPGDFFGNAAGGTVLLALAQAAITWGAPADFRPTKIGLAIAAVATLAFFGVLTVPQVPIAPLVLVPLLALSWLALRRAARATPEETPGVLADFVAPVRVRNLVMLPAIPLAATAVYTLLSEHQPDVQTHMVVAALSGLGGTVVFVVGLWRIVRRQAVVR